MSTTPRLPTEWSPEEDPALAAAALIAKQWQSLDAEHLTAAMAAMEPSLQRGHRERMARMKIAHQQAEHEFRERQAARAERTARIEYIIGAVIALSMMGGGIYAAQTQWWLSLLLCGPSLVALAKIFVLRRSDPDDMKYVTATSRTAANVAGQAQPPPPPPV